MNISGKKINELDSITPTLQTVLPAVYINGTDVSDTAGRISLQDIKSLIGGGGGGGGGGGIQSISWYDNNVGTELTIMDIPDTTVVNVYKNGVLLREGADNDYTVAGNVITFSISLEATDTICVIMGDPGMQLNLGDLSGAVVELSNIITAGKKQIANSLVNKGVTDIKYTDSLSKMADAIDALDTNGVGGVNSDFPIVISDSSYSLTYNETSLQKLGDYFCGYYDGSNIRVVKIPSSLSYGTTPASGKRYSISDIRNSSGWVVEDGQEITYTTSYLFFAPIFGSSVPLGRKFLYVGGTCRVIIDLDTSLNITSASARNMQLQDGTIIKGSSYSNPRILAVNFDKDMAIIKWPSINSVIKVTLSTGIYETINIGNLNALDTQNVKQIDLNTSLVYSTRPNTLTIINWNWESLEDSISYSIDLSNTSGPTMYGKSSGSASGISQLYIAKRVSDDQLKIWRYYGNTNTCYDTTINVNSLNRLSKVLYPSSDSDLYEGLVIRYLSSTQNKVLFSWGAGYLYLDVSSFIPTPIPYIKNSSLNSALSCYGWTSAQYKTDNYAYMSYWQDNILYVISGMNGGINLYFNSLDLVYNKVLATVAHKNGQEAIYKNITIVTRDNIADGGPFDPNTTILPVDI